MEKIGWKMGRKDVPKNTGSGRSAKPGVPTVFLVYRKKPEHTIFRRYVVL